jgi:hypothetical protein
VLAEMLALPLYYPFDLMKTRMQTTTVTGQYNNLFDAFVKTYKKDFPMGPDQYRVVMRNAFARIQRFYLAMSIYGGTYVAFIAIEFSLYETLLHKIEANCKG